MGIKESKIGSRIKHIEVDEPLVFLDLEFAVNAEAECFGDEAKRQRYREIVRAYKYPSKYSEMTIGLARHSALEILKKWKAQISSRAQQILLETDEFLFSAIIYELSKLLLVDNSILYRTFGYQRKSKSKFPKGTKRWYEEEVKFIEKFAEDLALLAEHYKFSSDIYVSATDELKKIRKALDLVYRQATAKKVGLHVIEYDRLRSLEAPKADDVMNYSLYQLYGVLKCCTKFSDTKIAEMLQALCLVLGEGKERKSDSLRKRLDRFASNPRSEMNEVFVTTYEQSLRAIPADLHTEKLELFRQHFPRFGQIK